MAKKKIAKKKPAKKAPAKKKAASKKAAPKKAVAKKSAKKAPLKKVAAKKSAAKKTLAQKPVKKAAKKAAPAKKVSLAPVKEVTFRVGDVAPLFNLPNEKGESVSLYTFRGQKVVLYFYPKDDTPGCTKESCDFRDNFARVNGHGAVVFGISRDSVKSHQKFQDKYSLPFSLLSDEDGKVCEAYGVWKEKNNYGKAYMGIERTTFIIDEEGSIIKVYPKVSVEGHVDEVLGDLA